MNSIFKKTTAVAGISSQIASLALENQKLNERGDSALSIFKDTVDELESVNAELEVNREQSVKLSEQLQDLAATTAAEIDGNKKVITKIKEIFN